MKTSDDQNTVTLDDGSIHEFIESEDSACDICSLSTDFYCSHACTPWDRFDKRNGYYAKRIKIDEISDPEDQFRIQNKSDFLGCFIIAILFIALVSLLIFGHLSSNGIKQQNKVKISYVSNHGATTNSF